MKTRTFLFASSAVILATASTFATGAFKANPIGPVNAWVKVKINNSANYTCKQTPYTCESAGTVACVIRVFDYAKQSLFSTNGRQLISAPNNCAILTSTGVPRIFIPADNVTDVAPLEEELKDETEIHQKL